MPTILDWRRSGKIGHGQHKKRTLRSSFFRFVIDIRLVQRGLKISPRRQLIDDADDLVVVGESILLLVFPDQFPQFFLNFLFRQIRICRYVV